MFLHYTRKSFFTAYSVILGSGLIAFIVRLYKFDQFTLPYHIAFAVTGFFVVVIMWEALRLIDRLLNQKYPFERSIATRIVIQLLLGLVLGLLLRLILEFFRVAFFPIKVDVMFLATTWFIYGILPAIVNLGFFTHYFIQRWKHSLIRAEQLEREKTQVQFDNLRNQMNPHFLFNALSSLNSLIFEDQQLASRFLLQLSKVYRYVLQHKDQTQVSLGTELRFIENYVSLMKTRFRDALIIEFRISPETSEAGIVPVTLQVLIENAVKHNIADPASPLRITIETTDGYLEVRNNLQQRTLAERSNHMGLDNLRRLYGYLTPQPLTAEALRTEFVVRVPLL